MPMYSDKEPEICGMLFPIKEDAGRGISITGSFLAHPTRRTIIARYDTIENNGFLILPKAI